MRIDCTQCEMYESEHCEDCLVTAVLHPPAGPVEIDQDLDPPLRELAGAGLIPVLKFRPRGAASAGPQNSLGAASAGPQNSLGAASAGPQNSLGAASAGPQNSLGAASAGPQNVRGEHGNASGSRERSAGAG